MYAQVLSSAKRSDNVWVKFITVPHEVAKAPNRPGYDCPVFEYWAKNVGLRRSSGVWKLVTNMDDIFSVSLLTFLNAKIKEKHLDLDGFYQNPRGSMVMPIPKGYRYDSLIHVEDKCIFHKTGGALRTCQVERTYSHIGNCGDFQLFHESFLTKFKHGGYLEIPQNWRMDSELLFRAMYMNSMHIYLVKNCLMCHQKHSKTHFGEISTVKVKKACDQEADPNQHIRNLMDGLLGYEEANSEVHPLYKQAYNKSGDSWGFKGKEFKTKSFH